MKKIRKMKLTKETLLRLQGRLTRGGTEILPDLPPNGGMTTFCGCQPCRDGFSTIF